MEIKYFKTVENGYIPCLEAGSAGDIEITQEEYENILNIIRSQPIPEVGYIYRLREDLTWELCETEIIDENEEEISHEEFMTMIEEVL